MCRGKCILERQPVLLIQGSEEEEVLSCAHVLADAYRVGIL